MQELLHQLGLGRPVDEYAPAAYRRDQETLQAIGADELGGYVATPVVERDVLVAGRWFPWRDARYVLGWGQDFVGVWDREKPGEPIRRFASTAEGEIEALKFLYPLLAPLILAAKEAAGRPLLG